MYICTKYDYLCYNMCENPVPVDVDIYYVVSMDYGHMNLMFPILAQVEILTSIHKKLFKV